MCGIDEIFGTKAAQLDFQQFQKFEMAAEH